MKRLLVGLVVVGLMLTGCGMLNPETPEEAMEQLPDNVEAAIRDALEGETGVAIEEFEIEEAERMEWPDACLGLGGEDEACAEVITPGWRVEVEVNGEAYELRTDEDASTVRLVED